MGLSGHRGEKVENKQEEQLLPTPLSITMTEFWPLESRGFPSRTKVNKDVSTAPWSLSVTTSLDPLLLWSLMTGLFEA